MNLTHEVKTLSDSTENLLSNNVNSDDYYNIDLTVQNTHGTDNVYLGVSGVSTTSFGIVLYPGAITTFSKLDSTDLIYAISNTNGSKVAIFKSNSIAKRSGVVY